MSRHHMAGKAISCDALTVCYSKNKVTSAHAVTLHSRHNGRYKDIYQQEMIGTNFPESHSQACK